MFDTPRYMRPYRAALRRRAARVAGAALAAVLALVAARAALAASPEPSRLAAELPVVVLFVIGVLAFATIERGMSHRPRRAAQRPARWRR